MTDSFSDDKPLSASEMMMAKDLMESKIAEAKANSKMTHLLMFGNFRMEIVPSANTDVEKIFKDTRLFGICKWSWVDSKRHRLGILVSMYQA